MILMVKSYKTASSRVEKPFYFEFVEACAEKGLAPNAELKKHMEEVVNERKNKSRLNSGTVRPVGKEIRDGLE
jgi:hypothetical protein